MKIDISFYLKNGIIKLLRKGKKIGVFYFMSSKEDKQRILLTDLPKYERQESLLRFNGLPNSYDDYAEIFGNDWKIAHQINHNSYKRRKKVKSKMTKAIAQKKAIFITFTFRDDVLDNTTEQTRRRYVSRCLKLASSRYVANIDFGDTTEREHYHAIVECDKFDRASWVYGFSSCQRVRLNSDEAIAKYIADKLSNHALKSSARAVRLIYSRKV